MVFMILSDCKTSSQVGKIKMQACTLKTGERLCFYISFWLD